MIAYCSFRSMANSSSVTLGKAEPTQDDIYRYPWKYIGYRGYAQFIASDSDLLVLRPFRDLSARIALRLQDKVSVLEAKLAELDESYSQESVPVNNGTIRDDKSDREVILDEINVALDRYRMYSLYHYGLKTRHVIIIVTDTFLIRQSTIRKFRSAPRRDIKNIKTWHENYDHCAIDKAEQGYLEQDDLICLDQRDQPPLRQLIDNSLRLRTLPIWRINSHISKKGLEQVGYYSDKRMNAFVSILITTIGMVLLIVPIWILEALNNLKAKLGVITIFVFVFLVALSSAMATKPFEALGATAA